MPWVVRAGGDPEAPPLKLFRKHSPACSLSLNHQLTHVCSAVHSPRRSRTRTSAALHRGCVWEDGKELRHPRGKQSGSQSRVTLQGSASPLSPPQPKVLRTAQGMAAAHPEFKHSPILHGPGPQHLAESAHLCPSLLRGWRANTQANQNERSSHRGGHLARTPCRALTGGVPQPLPVLLSASQSTAGVRSPNSPQQSNPCTPLTVYSRRRSLARRGKESSRPGNRRAAGISTEQDPQNSHWGSGPGSG